MVILLFLLAFPVVQSLVHGNETTTVGWVPDPMGRGTFGLVSSCLLTLGVCVWSAIHLNVPPPSDTQYHIWLRNVKWGLVGIFAPELILFAAWKQWNSAKTLTAEVMSCRQLQKDSQRLVNMMDEKWSKGGTIIPDRPHHEPLYPWTMVHSFYAGMGGFSFEVDSTDEETAPFFPGSHRLTITARGIALLAKCGYLPNINERDIADKSKADGIAKVFSCLQACWMVIQVIGRVVLGYPVTLLEVNVLGHVLCAIIIYILWWHKPRLVREPFRITGPWTKQLCAYMFMSSQVSGGHVVRRTVTQRKYIVPEFSTLSYLCPTLVGESGLTGGRSDNLAQVYPSELDTAAIQARSFPQPQDYGCFRVGSRFGSKGRDLANIESGQGLRSAIEQVTTLTEIKPRSWDLAAQAVHANHELQLRFEPPCSMSSNTRIEHSPMLEELVTHAASNYPGPGLMKAPNSIGLLMGIVLWFGSILYGAVHVAAWTAFFPSHIEMLLWRSSALCITVSGSIWVLINTIAFLSPQFDNYWEKVNHLKAGWSTYAVLVPLAGLCGTAYVIARLFLVAEAFLSLRKLPIEAYLTPNWIDMIPHL